MTSFGDAATQLAVLFIIAMFAAPIFTTAYLARRMRQPIELATA
jgi:hypothetical protein